MPFLIESSADPRIADFIALTDMDLRLRTEHAAGLFIAEGFLVLERVIAAGLSIRVILTDRKRASRVEQLISSIPADHRPDIAIAAPDLLEQITGFRVHRGVLASVERPPRPSVGQVVDTGGSLLALEGLVDPTNVGLAFRSAAAMGFTGAIVSTDCADPLYRRSVRTSMGAVIDLPWTRDANWPDSLQAMAKSVTVIALSPDPACPVLDDMLKTTSGPVAAVFGTEGAGLRRATRDIIASCARIPMAQGIDSLNIAATVAVVGYALRRAGVVDGDSGAVGGVSRLEP
jgi:tRNA G18 (ribose-2'-O)-methylase SpoU